MVLSSNIKPVSIGVKPQNRLDLFCGQTTLPKMHF